jgi:hypothetical protein
MKQKPRRYYTESGDRCDRMQVTYSINKNHIIMALYNQLSFNTEWQPNFKPNRTSIEKEIRQNLKFYGESWFGDINVEDELIEIQGREEELDIANWKIAEAEARIHFPKWFTNYHNKSLRFIKED